MNLFQLRGLCYRKCLSMNDLLAYITRENYHGRNFKTFQETYVCMRLDTKLVKFAQVSSPK
jgi:hypothetical protein